jgi:hypothetical protein
MEIYVQLLPVESVQQRVNPQITTIKIITIITETTNIKRAC